jgi:hypothetical protein
MLLTLNMLFERLFIIALLLTDFAIPLELLQMTMFYLLGEPFGLGELSPLSHSFFDI